MRTESSARRPRADLRTLSVAVAIHGGFLLWTLYFKELPLWLAAPLGSVLLAWYGSLQHETIHGHPTSSRRLNTLIGSAPLSLWIPYAIYRETHARHHRHSGARLTEVGHDPESFYLPPGHLARVGAVRRAVLLANCTLAGRIVLGPAIALATFWVDEVRKLRSNRRHRRIWLRHVLGVAAVLAWTVGVCDVPFLVYALLVVYPSISITHLRSFAEHRADDHSPARTNVVEANRLWGLIFLNNNLHVAHHAHPHVPWHELPRVWRGMRHSAPGAGLIFSGGYREVFRKYLFRPFITPEHPFAQVRSP
jgi:fatty acid desaturase